MKFFIKTYGCAQNQADSIIMKELLKKHGHSEANNESQAQILIVNTCTVKTPTEHKIKRYLHDNSSKKIIVCGCMTATHKEFLKKYSLMGCNNLLDLPKAMKGKIMHSVSHKKISKVNLVPIGKNEVIEIIPISNGCAGNCSYCATKLARGELQSYPKKDIVAHAKNAIKRGKKELWITSQDTGSYGLDLGTNLTELLDELISIPGFFKIRIGMMNPWHAKKLKKGLARILNNEKCFKFIHIPIQSASNKILKLMNRKYSKKDFEKLADYFRKEVKGIAIATDAIVGFPGETEKDYIQTYELINKIKPEVLNISKYCDRPYTKSSMMKGKISHEKIKERAAKLMGLHRKHILKRKQDFKGFALSDEKGFARTSDYSKIKTKKALGEYYEV
ncbi:MAG: tRNA (N(6)-L-threonylcarbamoyladenosine(37)-C(2))-methylthiotransferase [Candidatus Nanoarchaeia archaeon]|nr:tRNA (N(6)-L-threonylcarbamoyladenosine(37)-C(2))-methylthiotransferase [Candidatus Nanoarchaeia archaeon]